jgi:glyoxylase-like metal-dependent hydrolase (beta-lactamase superfamily II)
VGAVSDAYPELFAAGRWRVPLTSYLLLTDGLTVLVDTAIGPPEATDWPLDRGGGLPAGLAEHGVEPAGVDVVFLTHVQVDHVGWNADADGTPLFPNARYLIHYPDGGIGRVVRRDGRTIWAPAREALR